MLPTPYRVAVIRSETADTFTLALTPPEGVAAPLFAPGQFNMLYRFGVGEVPISISGDPDGGPLLHTIRAVGGVTGAMSGLEPGDALGVRGPYGRPWPAEAAVGGDALVIAGGIGLAPLRPLLYQLLAHRERYRRLILLYGARTPDDLLYRDELERWRAGGRLEVAVTVDQADSAWSGRVGVVTPLIAEAEIDPERTTAFVCGPEVMMRFAARELLACGVAEGAIQLSLERNMKCAVGHCGHCQIGPLFVCRDGPIFPYPRVRRLLSVWEV
jgi:NAD(P)H-flavin reductase